MTHFLANLVDRTRGTAPRVKPLIRPSIAPVAINEGKAEINPSMTSAEQTRTPATISEDAIAHDKAAAPPPLSLERHVASEASPLLVPLNPVGAHKVDHVGDATNGRSEGKLSAQDTIPAIVRAGDRREQQRSVLPRRQDESSPRVMPKDPGTERPVVRVTIGRIEVEAVSGPAPPPRKSSDGTRPALTLDAYLKSRKEGSR